MNSALTLLTKKLPLGNDTRITALGLQYPGVNLAMPYPEKLASLEDQSMIVPPPWASRLFLRCYLPGPLSTTEARRQPFVSPGLADDEDLRQFPPTSIVTAQYDHYRLVSANLLLSMRRADSQHVPGKSGICRKARRARRRLQNSCVAGRGTRLRELSQMGDRTKLY